jgi:hypothetical protein
MYRNVFFQEIEPGHWVQVNVLGEFDSDVWHALSAFLKRKETVASPLTPVAFPETGVIHESNR